MIHPIINVVMIFRAIITTAGGVPRPLYDLSPEAFAQLFDKAVGYKLDPPFNPYSNTVNYLLASYVIPYVGLVAYVGTIPPLANYTSRRVRTMHRSQANTKYSHFKCVLLTNIVLLSVFVSDVACCVSLGRRVWTGRSNTNDTVWESWRESASL